MRTISSCPGASTSIVLDLITRKVLHNRVHDFWPQIQMNKKKTQFFVFLGSDLSWKMEAEKHTVF